MIFRPGVELLTYLDGNLSSYGLDDPNLMVTDFHLPWWGGPRGQIKHTSYLSFSTLRDALAEHEKHLGKLGVSKSAEQPDFREGEGVNKTFYSWHPELYADLDTPCTRCRLYRAITFGTVDRLRDAENRSQGLAEANKGEVSIGMRRASGFYELYEEVLRKEVNLEQGPIPSSGSAADPDSDDFSWGGKKGKGKAKAKKGKTKVSEIAEHVRTEAEKQLREPRAFGEVKSKWTWGVDLNSQDIWEMTRGADKGYQIPHSGYDNDLRTGKLRSSSPIASPNDIEDPDDPNIFFDELTHIPFIRNLRPDEYPIAFSFPTLHYRAAAESGSGLEPPPSSSSEYTGRSDEEKETKRRGKQAMHDEVNSPGKPSTPDSHPIVPKQSPPHRPWHGPPPQDYIRPPTQTLLLQAQDVVAMRVSKQQSRVAYDDLEHMSEPDEICEPDSAPEPEPERLLLQDCQRNLDQMNFIDNSLDSDIAMHVDTSSGSDGEIRELRMTAEDTPTGLYGLVAPDLPDDSDEEINVGDLGRDTVDLNVRDDGTYALVVPDSSDDSDEEIGVGNLGLVAPDVQSDGEEEIEVGNLGLGFVDPGMWAETVVQEGVPAGAGAGLVMLGLGLGLRFGLLCLESTQLLGSILQNLSPIFQMIGLISFNSFVVLSSCQ